MSTVSACVKILEDTDFNTNSNQLTREITFASDKNALKYKTNAGGWKYFRNTGSDNITTAGLVKSDGTNLSTQTGLTQYTVPRVNNTNTLEDSPIVIDTDNTKVGIGVIPTNDLQIYTERDGQTTFLIQNNSSTSGAVTVINAQNDAGGITQMGQAGTNWYGYWGFLADGITQLAASGMGLIGSIDNNGFGICNFSNTPIHLSTNGYERMRIDKNGFTSIARSARIGSINGVEPPTLDVISDAYDPGNNNLVVDGSIGIGVGLSADTAYSLDINGATRNFQVSDTIYPYIRGSRKRATGTGGNLNNGDTVFVIDAVARVNNNYVSVADIDFIYTGTGTTRTGDIAFFTANAAAPAERMRITGAGLVGIGRSPTNQLHVGGGGGITIEPSTTSATAYLQLTNGSGSAYVGKERYTGGDLLIGSPAYSLVVSNQSNHPLVFGTNNTIRMTINGDGTVIVPGDIEVGPNAKFITVDGYTGFAIKVTVGEAVSKGQIVRWSNAADETALLSQANEDMPIGIATADIANGATGWVIQSGYAWIKFKSGVTGTRGDVVYCSDTIGLADRSGTVPVSATTHFRELGHCAKTGTSGGLALCTVHFN